MNKTPDKAIESTISELERQLENLKLQFNLYFSGERKTPPEHEREILTKAVQKLGFRSDRSPRISLMIQNLTSKFTLYSNMWLKKLNSIEMGLPVIKRETGTSTTNTPPPKPPKSKLSTVKVKMDDPGSFNELIKHFEAKLPQQFKSDAGKNRFINALKQRMEKGNIEEARMSLDFRDGKIKVKIS